MINSILPTNTYPLSMERGTIKNSMKQQIAKVTGQPAEKVDKKIHIFSFSRIEKKRKRKMDVAGFVIIREQQNFEKIDQLNPIEIKIEEDRIINFLKQYKNYTYQFKATGLLFSSNMVNETREIFLATNGLAQQKQL